MAYNIDDKTTPIARKMKTNLPLAIRFALNDVKRESIPITPMLTGDLRQNVRVNSGGNTGSIRWGQKYAKYQERGYTSGPVRKYTTPGTQAHFAEKSMIKVTRNPSKYLRKARIVT